MTRITDREIELAREVEWLRRLVGALSPDDLTPDQLKTWREEYRERAVVRVLLDECERAQDEIAMLRKENGDLMHTDEAEVRERSALWVEIERLRKENAELDRKACEMLDLHQGALRVLRTEMEVKLAKAREALRRIGDGCDGDCYYCPPSDPCVHAVARRTLKEISA